MEGGDLDHPITIRGRRRADHAGLLPGLHAGDACASSRQQEAQASAKVRNLITEMSHDLRTPLTTLLLYTEILRGRQVSRRRSRPHDDLSKIDAKARQIKQLSDNLFEYCRSSPGTPWPSWTRPHCFSADL